MNTLVQAAEAAQHAPSIFNTQPWSWRIDGDTMELLAEEGRRVDSIDPAGKLLLISCGAALHHARVTLAAEGWTVGADRLPEPARPELVARLRLGSRITPGERAKRMAGAITVRRTDRRAFGERKVPAEVLTELRRAVEQEGVYLHHVRDDQVATLAIATEIAAGSELDDPAYRKELAIWTSRSRTQGDGVAADTAVRPALRRVPVRDYFPGAGADLAAGAAHDQGAEYVVLFGLGDQPEELLRAGEALSALLLLATAEGLASAPLSDAVEAEWPKQLLRGLLAGLGEPYLIVRLGYAATADALPPSARRTTEIAHA